MKLVVKTSYGLEEILAEELTALGAEEVTKLNRAVSCEGDLTLMYKINYRVRTALRVLVPIFEFSASDEQVLYKRAFALPWERYIKKNFTFAIDSTVSSDVYTHSKYVALKTKDAIADRFRDKYGRRPNVDVDRPDIQFNIYVAGTDFTISLDSSGDSLHKRGYRDNRHPAPLNEVMAAGLIYLSGWDQKTPLYDPMCGSGTIAIEAAMIAANIPPGLYKSRYNFMNWHTFDKAIWEKVKAEADEQRQPCRVKIYASDISIRAVNMARVAAMKFDLGSAIEFQKSSFEKLTPSTSEGLIIMNPPYGERLDEDNTDELYKAIGDTFKQNFAGFTAWILSSNRESLKKIGLKTDRKLVLYNGSLECRFQKYTLYKGSKQSL